MSSMDVFIDHGTALGVADGAGVFVADSTGQVYVYGKVRCAFKSNATVIPLLDSRCVISGINRRTGEDVLVKGTNGEYCDLSYVSPLPQFQSGDIVVTSSLSLIHISEPTRLGMISYAVFCLKKKKVKENR